jgi:radical SAM protein with 4Fe4S-binding SPASM domain
MIISQGLYTYPLSYEGYQSRIHLRVHKDGTGILFVDVTDAIHLNETATLLCIKLLNGVSSDDLYHSMKKAFQAKENILLKNMIKTISKMIHSIYSSGHFCLDDLNEDDLELIQFIPLFSTSPKAPYKVDLALTYGCNDQCPHCYNEPSRFAMPSMRLEEWYIVLDKLAEQGVPHLILTGGEPTLHPNVLEIIRYANNKGFIVGMNSNGRRLAYPPFAEALKEAGLNHIQITVGSFDHLVHNAMMGVESHHQTIQGLQNAVAAGIYTITNTTLMKGTMPDVEKFITFLYNLGIRTFAMNSMIAAGGGIENENTLALQKLTTTLVQVREIAKLKNMKFMWYTVSKHCEFSPIQFDLGMKRCNAAEYSVCVEPNGNVLPCQSFYVPGGNLLFDNWETIWESDLFSQIRNRENSEAGLLSETCLACGVLENCGGGCMIERYADLHQMGELRQAGCFGCAGSAKLVNEDYGYIPNGFIPPSTMSSTTKRSSSVMNLPTKMD